VATGQRSGIAAQRLQGAASAGERKLAGRSGAVEVKPKMEEGRRGGEKKGELVYYFCITIIKIIPRKRDARCLTVLHCVPSAAMKSNRNVWTALACSDRELCCIEAQTGVPESEEHGGFQAKQILPSAVESSARNAEVVTETYVHHDAARYFI
jgi:hypothetical protein